MRREYSAAFGEGRQEWTVRKHRILRQYFSVAAAKLGRFSRGLVLVDGFAGANEYGEEHEGSTRLMVAQAKRFSQSTGQLAKVHACEVDPETRAKLILNLDEDIKSGVLTVHDVPHATAISLIRKRHPSEPMVVFLDPNKPTQMTLEDDIAPWCDRPQTDILGLYFGQQIHRIISGAQAVPQMEAAAASIVGKEWDTLNSGEKVFDAFLAKISNLVPFAGMYRLQKQRTGHIVYGIFGMSHNIAGYHLLSDAVARDFQNLRKAKSIGSTPNMFADEPEFNPDLMRFQELIQLARPHLADNPEISGKNIAALLLNEHRGKLFGQFVESKYNEAVRLIKNSQS